MYIINYVYLILGILLSSMLHLTVNIGIVYAMLANINTVTDAHTRLYGEKSVYVTFSVFLWITIVLNFFTFIVAVYIFIW